MWTIGGRLGFDRNDILPVDFFVDLGGMVILTRPGQLEWKTIERSTMFYR